MRLDHRLAQMRGLFRSGVVLLLTGVMLAAGCTTPRTTPPTTATPVTKNRVIDSYAANREVEEARRMMEVGDYNVVIPRLLHLISKYPESRAANEARYLLGVAYYKINGYRDAIDMFNEYLRMAPKGKYADKSAEYVAKLMEEYKQKFPTAEELDAGIEAARKKLEADPKSLAAQLELADLMWKRGDYSRAGRLYWTIVQGHPEYAQDATVKSRIELLPGGEYTVLTPVEVQRRQIAAQPVVVVNVNAFHSGADLFTRQPKYYVVTGQVVNRGDSVLYGVQVIVTIFGFGNVVYDTNTVTIGRMNPEEIRAFSVRFSSFENISNIYRHECVVSFQR